MSYNHGSYSLVGLLDGAPIMQGKRTRTLAAAQPQPTAEPPRKRRKQRRSRAPKSQKLDAFLNLAPTSFEKV